MEIPMRSVDTGVKKHVKRMFEAARSVQGIEEKEARDIGSQAIEHQLKQMKRDLKT